MEKGEFGLRLRGLRKQAGLNQRELADAVGVDFSYLSKIENGVMPAPSEEVIRRLAKVLKADRDELMSLAGKVPSDITQILKSREVRQSLKEDGNGKKARAVNKRDSFNKRLKELREQAGLNQRELADKIGVNFSYLSKIESGVKPPPSEKVILKLAEALNCDRDELMASAGKMPSDMARILKSREVRQSLRESRTQKMMSAGDNRKGVSIMKYLISGRSLARTALAIVLVGAVAASLWFASPSQVVKALKIEITNPAGNPLESGTIGRTYYFKVKATIENGELVPIQNIGLSIFNSANASYNATLTGLPMINGGSANYTNAQTGGGTVNVTAATLDFGLRPGFGYAVWRGYAYNFPYSLGYGALTGEVSITYTIAWTPPLGWPVGNYQIVTAINAGGVNFVQPSSEFTLQGLLAETSIAQGLSGNTTDVVVVKANINRIKDLSGNTTAIPGGIGSYSATVSGNASSAIQFRTVYGVSPFNNPTFDNVTGVFAVAVVASPIQPNNTPVAEVVPILTGNTTSSVNLTITFQIISAATPPGLNVPEEQANTMTFLRGNAKDNDAIVDINDALFIAQYIVGQRTLGGIGALNAAGVKHDGAGGDWIDINDALFIAQYIVGQRNAYFQ